MSALEQFVTAMSNAGPLATGLAIAAVPVVAGVAVYVAKLGAQAKIDGLEGDARRLNDRIEDLQASHQAELVRSAERYRELEARYDAVLSTRALLQSQLDLITTNVADIAMRLNAKDYSILVPAPTLVPGDRPNELVFLCASGPQGTKLRSVRVPIDTSMSGQVFLSGSATIASPPPSGTASPTRRTRSPITTPTRRSPPASIIAARRAAWCSSSTSATGALMATMSSAPGILAAISRPWSASSSPIRRG